MDEQRKMGRERRREEKKEGQARGGMRREGGGRGREGTGDKVGEERRRVTE